eukprot:TRINITY_DN43869_c0_g1_i1.p1 TRINITY_DN43869_c0_g1~~TRINITY_DN43869_c0_g1_i1.p1  ORF type:complete len:113 (+),score=4.96 TRINITY_DN43869_c0_g1_i1:29-340(+)
MVDGERISPDDTAERILSCIRADCSSPCSASGEFLRRRLGTLALLRVPSSGRTPLCLDCLCTVCPPFVYSTTLAETLSLQTRACVLPLLTLAQGHRLHQAWQT